jgi:hypothetical protein
VVVLKGKLENIPLTAATAFRTYRQMILTSFSRALQRPRQVLPRQRLTHAQVTEAAAKHQAGATLHVVGAELGDPGSSWARTLFDLLPVDMCPHDRVRPPVRPCRPSSGPSMPGLRERGVPQADRGRDEAEGDNSPGSHLVRFALVSWFCHSPDCVDLERPWTPVANSGGGSQ